jgi:presequence protease
MMLFYLFFLLFAIDQFFNYHIYFEYMTATDNFELIKQNSVPEYSSELKLYIHTKSGAQVLFMENEDTNKVFGVSFRTPVSDSTGVPHILEHSVLNGSQNYPVKEPFVNLVKSSLNTFLNAMTYPDRTVYPVASQNKKDLYNLAKVYMDAVFFPNLTIETFKQEGWHYELEAADKPVIYKGVVFNEMKGVYSDPDNLYFDNVLNNLNPDNTYKHDSGGNPITIPTLTYEQFINFHKSFYHPSNCLVYIYGDDLSDDRFELVAEYLDKFDKVEVESQIENQKLLTNLEDKVAYFDPGEDASGKGYSSVSWLLSKKENLLPYHILDKILTGSPTAPLYKALISSGLGEDTAPLFGFELDLVQPLVSYGLKGVSEKDMVKVLDLVNTTLADIARKGLDSKDIEPAINSIEFQLREYDTGRYPKGLSMMLDMVVDWVYDRDFMSSLAFEKDLQDLKEKIVANPRFFEDLIQQDFLDNKHKLNFAYKPRTGYLEKVASEEIKELDSYKNTLTSSEIDQLILDTQKLKEFQNREDTPEQLATLPKLDFGDLQGKPEVIPSDKSYMLDVPVYYHDIHTNGVAYIDVGFNLEMVEAKYYPYISLYSRLLTELDTDTHSANEINQLLDLHTGNFSAAVLNLEKVESQDAIRYLFLRGKALPNNSSNLLEIWVEILSKLKLDNKEKIKQILIDLRSSLEASILSDGKVYGVMAVNSLVSKSGSFDEVTRGYKYLVWLRETIARIDTEWQSILSDLQYIKDNLFVSNAMVVNLTSESKYHTSMEIKITNFIGSFQKGTLKKSNILIKDYTDKTVFIVPTKVNYVCYGLNLKEVFAGNLSGQWDVAVNHLNYDYLWDKIRAQGGAYGSRATIDKLTGVLNIWSYRDPRFEGTMQDYSQVAGYLKEIKLTKNDILSSIIGTIGKFDAYMSPREKGWVSLVRSLTNRSYEELSQIRQQILEAVSDDFHLLGDTLAKSFDTGKWAVFSSQASFDGIEDRSGFEIIKPL